MVEVCWILNFTKPEVVLVDKEYADLVKDYGCKRIIVDDDVDGKTGAYEDIVRRGQEIDAHRGSKGWDNLLIDDIDELDTMVLNCTSGTTSNPKVFDTKLKLTIVCRDYVSWNISCCPCEYNRVRTEFGDSTGPWGVQI